jgi:myo-inositol-1(or 4)-monophosphatase
VTEADRTADASIAQALRDAFPEDGIISEELQPVYAVEAESVWVIDPLDGTTNFALGLPHWGVSLARLTHGYPVVAAVYFPLLGELYTAQRGEGAFLNEQRLYPNPDVEKNVATFFACCSRTHRHYRVGVRYKARILGSAAYNFCAAARGMAALAFEAQPKIWDLAGAWLVVREAGGLIEPLDGLSPFPIVPGTDYRQQNYPTLASLNAARVAIGHEQLVPISKEL